MRRFERFIEGHRGEGELVDQGSFTLKAQEAQRKISRYGMGSPETVLLRLVQFAVSDGCESIDISIERAGVVIRAVGIERLAEDVERLEEQMRLDTNGLALALLAAVHSGFSRGRVSCGSTLWSFGADGFERSAPPVTLEPGLLTLRLERAASPGFWTKLRELLRRRCVDYTVLRDRLRHTPIPIKVDGLPVATDPRPTRVKVLMELTMSSLSPRSGSGLNCLAERKTRFGLGAKRLTINRGPWRTFAQSARKADPRFFGDGLEESAKPSQEVVLAHLWVPFRKGKGTLTLVADGVVVGQTQLDFPLPVFGVVSAAGLDRDLSGLGIARNSRLERLKHYLTDVLSKELKRLGECADLGRVRAVLKATGFLQEKAEEPSAPPRKRKGKTKDVPLDPCMRPYAEAHQQSRSSKQFLDSRRHFNVQRRNLKDRGRLR